VHFSLGARSPPSCGRRPQKGGENEKNWSCWGTLCSNNSKPLSLLPLPEGTPQNQKRIWGKEQYRPRKRIASATRAPASGGVGRSNPTDRLAGCVRQRFPVWRDNGGKPRRSQSGVPPTTRAPIEQRQGGIVCHLRR
jgi:hypothetical protein